MSNDKEALVESRKSGSRYDCVLTLASFVSSKHFRFAVALPKNSTGSMDEVWVSLFQVDATQKNHHEESKLSSR